MADQASKKLLIDQIGDSIADDVANGHEDELETISASFNKALNDALRVFNSTTFDDDGFVKKMRGLEVDQKKDQDMIKNVLNNIQSDYLNADTLNQTELLMRRDLYNICTQMPEMHDVITTVRDSIIECSVATGEVSRSLIFENHEDHAETYESQAKEIEARHDLMLAIKNFIVPKGLMNGEMYIQCSPYSKIFAEIAALRDRRVGGSRNFNTVQKESHSIFSDHNLSVLMESTSHMTKVDAKDTTIIEKGDTRVRDESVVRGDLSGLLHSIDVYTESSPLITEYGADGAYEFLRDELKRMKPKTPREQHFTEAQLNYTRGNSGPFGDLDQDDLDDSQFKDIKGAYLKYLNPLRLTPIRMDRRVVGYYYVTTTMDLQTNPANPNGIVDLSYQHYTRDRNVIDQLANIIIRSFDKKMLQKNIKLKNEIAEIIMAHKFSEGKLSFIYIPENEVVRIVINEDEDGKGHSIIEPSLFPARLYLMLTMYNMIFTLNNNTTRVHYLRSSGLDKDYSAQIQRTMRKFQSRRITIDDIYSYSGVLNKIGGMGEMILPSGRNDYRAIDTDTIEAVRNPIDIEFLEQQRRQAISGTGVPSLLVINAIDEVDFAKTLEMANTRFLSAVSSYKIDFNKGITKLYQKLMKYETDMEEDIINSFKFKFDPIKQQTLSITADMVNNFNSLVELVMSLFYSKDEMEDKKGVPSSKQRYLRKELAKEYLPQLDFDRLEEVVARVNNMAQTDDLQVTVSKLSIEPDDVEEAE